MDCVQQIKCEQDRMVLVLKSEYENDPECEDISKGKILVGSSMWDCASQEPGRRDASDSVGAPFYRMVTENPDAPTSLSLEGSGEDRSERSEFVQIGVSTTNASIGDCFEHASFEFEYQPPSRNRDNKR